MKKFKVTVAIEKTIYEDEEIEIEIEDTGNVFDNDDKAWDKADEILSNKYYNGVEGFSAVTWEVQEVEEITN